MKIAVLGIDLGKNVCSVVGLDPSGAVVLRRRVRRDTLIDLVVKLPSCIVGMEACCGAHHLGRLFAAQGHDIRLMSPEYVRPYVKAQKNDDRDAEGIAEATTRPTMRFVEMKTEDQLDMQTLHRSRERLVGERTALINQLRAILLDRGIVVPQGKRKLEQYLVILMNEHDGEGLSARMRMLVADIRAQWQELDRRIGEFDAEFVRWAKENEDARRLVTIPGVGVTISTALIAAVGKAETFEHGRDLAAWLGLVPRQSTTGGKPRLMGITPSPRTRSTASFSGRQSRNSARTGNGRGAELPHQFVSDGDQPFAGANKSVVQLFDFLGEGGSARKYYACSNNCHGGVTQTKWLPTNLGRFSNFSMKSFECVIRSEHRPT